MPEERFPGRGYLPQALSHGTREARDKEATVRFLTDVLGFRQDKPLRCELPAYAGEEVVAKQ